jgi:hypothetical protein
MGLIVSLTDAVDAAGHGDVIVIGLESVTVDTKGFHFLNCNSVDVKSLISSGVARNLRKRLRNVPKPQSTFILISGDL